MRPKTSHLILLAAAAAMLLATGCRRGVVRTESGLQTGRVTANRLANLQRLAARDTGCMEAELEPRELDRGVYEVVGHGGCQVVRHYVMACPNRWRCRWQAVPPIEDQAMMDLSCQPDSIWVRATGHPMTRHVFACGVMAPYELQCWQNSCTWSQAGPAQQAAMPANATEVRVGEAEAAPANADEAPAEGASMDLEIEAGAEAEAEAGTAPPEPWTQ